MESNRNRKMKNCNERTLKFYTKKLTCIFDGWNEELHNNQNIYNDMR